ncbi:hypothetical protein ACIO6U_02930 [Streptomyces sp. NPDC087422]|uniref:hypothetical protein n=1 Tax=Streptomyces sp. NPDC087422 TaxID=3365786 RepID=UPI00381EA2F0
MADIENQPTAVYRLYETGGRLLYVGMTNNPDVRFKWHSRMHWWHRVARKDVEWHSDRTAARHHEAAAIKSEEPILNAMHAAAGVDDVPLRDARPKLSQIVDQVRVQHVSRWLTRFGERTVAVVHPEFHDAAVANERIVNALREVNPALYEQLANSDA